MARLGWPGIVAALALSAGCSFSGLNFAEDDRVTITAPADRAEVKLPVTIRWTVDEFETTGRDGARRDDAGYFGLYLDRAPQPPGETQASLVEDTEGCRRDSDCPSREYLARQDVYSTAKTQFTIERIPDPDPDDDRREFHTVTIVLLNGRGERIGESAFRVTFEVDRTQAA